MGSASGLLLTAAFLVVSLADGAETVLRFCGQEYYPATHATCVDDNRMREFLACISQLLEHRSEIEAQCCKQVKCDNEFLGQYCRSLTHKVANVKNPGYVKYATRHKNIFFK